MKKVTLFFPKTNPEDSKYESAVLAPLSLMALASPLRADGWDVKILDNRVDDDCDRQVLDSLADSVCLGISAMTGFQIKDGLRLAELARGQYPDLPIIWGGYHPSSLPEQTAEHPLVDAVVRGQGEVTFGEIVEALEAGKSFDGIAGITYAKDGQVIVNPDRSLVDPNEFPPMAYDAVRLEKYIHLNRGLKAINYVSSVGCPHRCAFCSNVKVYGRRWKGLSPERVVDELEALVKNYGIGLIFMDDNNFFINKERVRRISELMIERKLNLQWFATVRAEQFIGFDEEFLNLATQAGFIKAMVGAESGDQRILDLASKDRTVQDAIKCAEMCKKHGIQPSFSYIFGFPFETAEEHETEMKATLDLIKTIKQTDHNSKVTMYFFTPYPGTALFEYALKANLDVPQRLDEWAQFDPRGTVTPWISEEEKSRIRLIVERYIEYAYPTNIFKNRFKGFTGSPRYILHVIARYRVEHSNYALPFERLL